MATGHVCGPNDHDWSPSGEALGCTVLHYRCTGCGVYGWATHAEPTRVHAYAREPYRRRDSQTEIQAAPRSGTRIRALSVPVTAATKVGR